MSPELQSRLLVLLACALIFSSGSPALAESEEGPAVAPRAFVSNYCLDCHLGEGAEAGLRLDLLNTELHKGDSFRSWASVYERVRKGEMPPADYGQPPADEKAAFLDSLSEALTQADRKHQRKFGRSELRRLSRAEYANSLKDILALPHLELEAMLPPDSLAHGYPKSARALDFSHVMVSRYLEVADKALWRALAPRAEGQQSEIIRAELKGTQGVKNTLQTLYVQLKHTTGMALIGTKRDPTLETYRGDFQKRKPGGVHDPEPHLDGVATFMHSRANHNVVLKPFKVKQSGYYKLRVHGWGLLNDHGKLLSSDRTETVAFYTPSGRLLGRCDLPPNVPTTSEVTVWLNDGEPIEYLAVSAPNEWIKLGRRYEWSFEHFKAYGIGLQWFEMEGPLSSDWPPESHRRLLGDMELEPTKEQPNGLAYRVVTDHPEKDARRLLRRFATKAYRRPLKDADLKIPLGMVRNRLERGEPFVDSLLAGYRAVLTSPEFLLLEQEPGRLDDWAVASRLSFFLWNSPPDPELRHAAARGKLMQEAELRRQTERMLTDPKSDRFINHFLDYWLDLRKIRLTEPDENLYPEHNALLTESMVEETRAFFDEMVQSDLGALHVIDSDFLTINQRLARLYARGADGEQGNGREKKTENSPAPTLPVSRSPFADVHGSRIRKVSIPPDSPRGGLLTQGSLLKITANGTTTSPVVRGTFTLTKLLGDPPPPPPPSVPAIEPDISGATTIRDQLARHRADPSCALCHQKIDPPGFALESFDVMGGYREHYRAAVQDGEKGASAEFNGKPVNYRFALGVDCAGQLPGGESFADVNELRELLTKREAQIARNLLGELIVYATGTPVGFADRPIVDDMMSRLEQNRYGIRSMIHEIIQSKMFRHK